MLQVRHHKKNICLLSSWDYDGQFDNFIQKNLTTEVDYFLFFWEGGFLNMIKTKNEI